MSRSWRTEPYEIRAARRTRGSVPIRVTAPRPGHIHPATPSDIRALLTELGPLGTYRVRRIELRQQESARGARELYGQTRYPGLIRLYEQPHWRTSPLEDMPMRDFMLHVLLHELGHHIHDHRSGKRPAPTLRTTDAEHTADLFARRHTPALARLRHQLI
ncbi:hypothetical protein VMT65_23145 [Nocardia sp. CDC153]|uniref:hypothetical protein n=1 Tax=Nocardia sp. CDC153 TaxID=3112167 RepID=UPI002DB7A2E0|nr:hypothetical protein [Nocardia sp. CDC153]MEC3955950.1 hypothetical protein [Nocardia sp. CDC153]